MPGKKSNLSGRARRETTRAAREELLTPEERQSQRSSQRDRMAALRRSQDVQMLPSNTPVPSTSRQSQGEPQAGPSARVDSTSNSPPPKRPAVAPQRMTRSRAVQEALTVNAPLEQPTRRRTRAQAAADDATHAAATRRRMRAQAIADDAAQPAATRRTRAQTAAAAAVAAAAVAAAAAAAAASAASEAEERQIDGMKHVILHLS